MRLLDDAILARVADVEFAVHDGYFDARPPGETVVVSIPMPYAVFYSSVGDDDEATRRLSARIARDSVFWTFTYVGLDRNQTKWAGELLHERMKRWRPEVDGYQCEIVQRLESQRIRRDDDAVRPDGSPLFYGVSNYAAGVRLR